MSKVINQVLKYRQRGYMLADGTECEIFGNDPAPVNADGSAPKLIWDHDVSTQTQVSPHVDATALDFVVAPNESGAV